MDGWRHAGLADAQWSLGAKNRSSFFKGGGCTKRSHLALVFLCLFRVTVRFVPDEWLLLC